MGLEGSCIHSLFSCLILSFLPNKGVDFRGGLSFLSNQLKFSFYSLLLICLIASIVNKKLLIFIIIVVLGDKFHLDKSLTSSSSTLSSATSGGILDRAIEAEDKKHGDLLRLVIFLLLLFFSLNRK